MARYPIAEKAAHVPSSFKCLLSMSMKADLLPIWRLHRHIALGLAQTYSNSINAEGTYINLRLATEEVLHTRWTINTARICLLRDALTRFGFEEI